LATGTFNMRRTNKLVVLFLAGRAIWPGAGGVSSISAAPTGPGCSFDTVRERARTLASKEYRAEPAPELPDSLKKLTYEEYRDIRFRPERAPWHQEPLRFGLGFFHRGFLFQDPVRVHLVENGEVRDFDSGPEQFDFGRNQFPKPVPSGLHFAGVQVLYAPDASRKREEVAAFLGASYFRLASAGRPFGTAGRGLAIDTAEPGGEEFPKFTEYWIEKPGEAANYLQLYALLDSPSVTGAYRFVLKPGENTVSEIEASLFIRKEGRKLGFAPLTSMFYLGKNRPRFIADYRPEVHDSDGLLIRSGAGDWLWRPLTNPQKKHQVSRFDLNELAGFGLVQRERDFHQYEDLETRYDLRPSLWVEPRNNWGTGVVELIEIPSPAEWNDNVVAYWIPKQKPVLGQEFHWIYGLSALRGQPDVPGLLRVTSTRVNPEHDKLPSRFIIDFTGEPASPTETAPVEAKVQSTHCEIRNLTTRRNQATGGWRATFEATGPGSDPSELRLWLHRGDKVLSETWVYRFPSA
jgi:glucans biosynthesis protein